MAKKKRHAKDRQLPYLTTRDLSPQVLVPGPLATRIHALRTALGVPLKSKAGIKPESQENFAARFDVEQATVSRWEKGEFVPPEDTIADMARMANLSVAEFRYGPVPTQITAEPPPESNVEPAPFIVPPQNMPLTIPILGTAAAGDGVVFELDQTPVDWVPRPTTLQNAQNAYAIFVAGDSMVPKYTAGDLVFAHPGKPPIIGGDVIVQLHDGGGVPTQGLLKKLLIRTATKIVLWQHNPPDGHSHEITLSPAKIHAIHHVLSVRELIGI